MRIAAYSFDVRVGEFDANLRAVEAALREAAARGIELVALPEMWATSFPPAKLVGATAAAWIAASDHALERVRELSRECGLVVIGSCLARAPGRGAAPRNRVCVLDGGRELARYDKVHLFSATAEHERFSAGRTEPSVVDVRGVRMAVAVCYDLRFAELFVPLHAQAVELLVVCAQWPVVRAAQWRALVVGRAVELQAFVLGANRSGSERIGRTRKHLEFAGNSIVAAPDGAVLAEGTDGCAWAVADIDVALARRMRVRVPVSKDRARRRAGGARALMREQGDARAG